MCRTFHILSSVTHLWSGCACLLVHVAYVVILALILGHLALMLGHFASLSSSLTARLAWGTHALCCLFTNQSVCRSQADFVHAVVLSIFAFACIFLKQFSRHVPA